jgi:hypothetical protein
MAARSYPYPKHFFSERDWVRVPLRGGKKQCQKYKHNKARRNSLHSNRNKREEKATPKRALPEHVPQLPEARCDPLKPDVGNVLHKLVSKLP